MRIIAIDTSDSIASWVGIEDGKVVDPRQTEKPRQHDEALADGVQRWIKKHGWTNLDAVAVVVGPGGFTGLRVGVAFATGFAAAKGIPVIPVSSYELLAARAPEAKKIWALAFAGRGEVRGKLMSGGKNPEPLDEVRVFTLENPFIPEYDVLPLGAGYERYKKEIDEFLKSKRLDKMDLISFPEALAFAANFAYKKERFFSPLEIDVDYGVEFRPTVGKKK